MVPSGDLIQRPQRSRQRFEGGAPQPTIARIALTLTMSSVVDPTTSTNRWFRLRPGSQPVRDGTNEARESLPRWLLGKHRTAEGSAAEVVQILDSPEPAEVGAALIRSEAHVRAHEIEPDAFGSAPESRRVS